MATIATLNVMVKATTSPFKKALKTAGATARKFGKSIAAIGKKVAKFGALVATGAVAGLTALTVQAFKAIDVMGKLSGNIGIATDKLAGFHLAAELAGLSTDAMDKALKKMQRNIGNAGLEMAAQVKALKLLGTSFTELKNLTPTEQFLILADGVKGLNTSVERAAVVSDIFGRAGIDLINVLAGGSEALKKAQEEADAFGLSLSGIETRQVEQANDAFLKLKRSFTGIGRQIAKRIAPLVEFLADAFTNAAKSGGGIGKAVETAVNVGIKAMGGMLDVITLIERGWAKVFLGIAKANLAIIKMIPGAKTINAEIGVVFAQAFELGLKNLPSGAARIREFLSEITKLSVDKAKKAVLGEGFDLEDLPGIGLPTVEETKKREMAIKRATEGSRVLGRTGRQGFIGSGGVVGAQRLSAVDKDTKKTAENTARTADGIQRLIRAFSQDGLPVTMV